MIFFFFNDTATTEIYTLSLHDALPIYDICGLGGEQCNPEFAVTRLPLEFSNVPTSEGCELVRVRRHPAALLDIGELEIHARSEEHTSELQSRQYLVCRLLLEKKKTTCEQRGSRGQQDGSMARGGQQTVWGAR